MSYVSDRAQTFDLLSREDNMNLLTITNPSPKNISSQISLRSTSFSEIRNRVMIEIGIQRTGCGRAERSQFPHLAGEVMTHACV